MKKVILIWTIILLILCGYVFYQSSNIEGSLCNKIKEKIFHSYSDSNPKLDLKYFLRFSKMDIPTLHEKMTGDPSEENPPYNVSSFGDMLINYQSDNYDISHLQRTRTGGATSFTINFKGHENLVKELIAELNKDGYREVKYSYSRHMGYVSSGDVIYRKGDVDAIVRTEPTLIYDNISWNVTIILSQNITTRQSEKSTQSEPKNSVDYFIQYNGERIKVTEQNIKNGYIPVDAIDKENGEYTDLLITKNADGSLNVKESGEYYDGD